MIGLGEKFDRWQAAFSEWATAVFGPGLKSVFQPIDAWLQPVYMPWARVLALSLFFGAMIWVWTLRVEYVNVDRPNTKWYTDLRVWTVLCMLPHVIVYLVF